MNKKVKTVKRRNPQDSILRNIQAANKRLSALERRWELTRWG
jgi:hypothetical protein